MALVVVLELRAVVLVQVMMRVSVFMRIVVSMDLRMPIVVPFAVLRLLVLGFAPRMVSNLLYLFRTEMFEHKNNPTDNCSRYDDLQSSNRL